MVVNPDGTVSFALPRAEVGQGITTAVAMTIADEMDLAIDQVNVKLPDARPELLFNQLTGGSNTMQLDGPAQLRRRERVRGFSFVLACSCFSVDTLWALLALTPTRVCSSALGYSPLLSRWVSALSAAGLARPRLRACCLAIAMDGGALMALGGVNLVLAFPVGLGQRQVARKAGSGHSRRYPYQQGVLADHARCYGTIARVKAARKDAAQPSAWLSFPQRVSDALRALFNGIRTSQENRPFSFRHSARDATARSRMAAAM